MQINLSRKEFRLLLDMVYIGNWVLNSTRGEDRFKPYDDIESKLFGLCRDSGMKVLVEKWNGEDVPSKAYCDGGIHEAIAYYEDNVFYQILDGSIHEQIPDQRSGSSGSGRLTYLGKGAASGTFFHSFSSASPAR